jgi:hypothetical protein
LIKTRIMEVHFIQLGTTSRRLDIEENTLNILLVVLSPDEKNGHDACTAAWSLYSWGDAYSGDSLRRTTDGLIE